MVRKIKFPLVMKNGAEVRGIEELKENFDLESIITYFFNGKLKIWLQQRNYINELELVIKLQDSNNQEDIAKKLCEIFNVQVEKNINIEEIKIKKEREKKLLQHTDDETWKEKLDYISFNQEELNNNLLSWNFNKSEKEKEIYLCGEEFVITDEYKDITYIGVNKTSVKLNFEEKDKENRKTIRFKNIILKSDSKINFNCEVDDKCDIDESNINTATKYITNIKTINTDKVSSDTNFADKMFLTGDNIIYHSINELKIVNIDTLKITKEREDIRIAAMNKSKDKFIVVGKEDYKEKCGVIILDVKNLNNIKEYYILNDFNILLWSEYDNCMVDTKCSLNAFSSYVTFIYENILNIFFEYGYQRLVWIMIDINTGKYIGSKYFENIHYSYHENIDYDKNMLYLASGWNSIRSFDDTVKLEEPKINTDIYWFNADNMGPFVVNNNNIITTWGCMDNDMWEPLFDMDNEKSFFRGFIGVYDISTGKELKLFKAHETKIIIIKKVKDMLITVDKEMILKLWNINNLEMIGEISLCKTKEEIEEQLKQLDLASYKEKFFLVDYDELTDRILIKFYKKILILG